MSKKLTGAILALGFTTIIGGLILAFFESYTEPPPHKQTELTAEQMITLKIALFTKGTSERVDEQLTKMVGYDIDKVRVCWDCKQFQEWSQGSAYILYPVIGHQVSEDQKHYTLVVGQVGWHASEPSKMYVTPKNAMYIEDGSNVVRVSTENVTSYDKSSGWLWDSNNQVNHESSRQYLRGKALSILQKPVIQDLRNRRRFE